MKETTDKSSLFKKVSEYILTPPVTKQYEKQKWSEKEAERRRGLERREMLVAMRTLCSRHSEKQSLRTHDSIVKLWSGEKERRVPKKDRKALVRKLFQRLLGELIGTFILVLCYASMRVELKLKRINVVDNALGQGLVVIALVYSLGGISGAHLNPVVTFVFTIRRTFPLIWLPLYNIVQFIAALAAGGILRMLYEQDAIYGANSIDLSTLSSHVLGFGWETIISFFLQFVVLQTATRDNIIGPFAALAVGSINVVNAIVGNINSSSMNPTRTLGPALINSSQDDNASLWVYIAGPYLGGLIATILVSLLNFNNSSADDDDKGEMKMAQGEE